MADAMTELMDDDIGEDRGRRENEPPVERQRTALRAGAPPRQLIADRQARVRHVEALRLTLDGGCQLGTRLLPVPQFERNDRRNGKREAADPDHIVALKPEVECLRRLGELAL